MSTSSAPSTYTAGYANVYNTANSLESTDASTSASQLSWAQNLWSQQQPQTNAYESNMSGLSSNEISQANQASAAYTGSLPALAAFTNTAENYNTPTRANQNAASAEADVSSSYNAQRASSLQSLESYGIDPSQTRYSALDLGTRISQAAATASAGTTSRLNTENTGLSLEQSAANLGTTQGSLANTSGSTAASTGSSGISANLNTANTYGNLTGTAATWSGLANSANNSATTALQDYSNTNLQNYTAQTSASNSLYGGIGSLLGGLGSSVVSSGNSGSSIFDSIATGLGISDRRVKDDITRIGETGMGIPIVTFRYKGTPELRVGVIAQDVEKVIPEAVWQNVESGIRMVDYARIR